jgi:hypothetical protein
MDNFVKLFFFYSSSELNIKDVETEFFTDNREKIYFFLFHNKELHFSRSEILKRSLHQIFENIDSNFEYIGDSLVMTRQIKHFDTVEFDKSVDKAFEDYLVKINYRIDCVIQTISLFLDLYKDRNIVFVLPNQIFDRCETLFKERNENQEILSKENKIIVDWNIIEKINYYTKINSESNANLIVEDYNNIISIVKVN